MTYELRTYDLRPHSVVDAERRLAAACEEAVGDGDLVASFHSEIGLLNQVIQVWRHDGDVARERAGSAAAAAGAAIEDLVVGERAVAIIPFAVSPAIEPSSVGPFFEIRTYAYADGELPKIVAAWEAALPARLALGPLVLVGSAEEDAGNTLVHIWPYASLDARWELRERVRAAGIWPPPVVARRLGLPSFELLRMENTIVVPAAFSPLR